ncbi:hypothetical protein [Roseibium sp. RKSG952]|uniref:hypothetical protein n=1 Tax=Roseibium sp. RKSG952 TaxID=2529384 RepID=UPI0012BC4D31|nr:hypothetical protein [Roseibium sp. RKSG952]MTH96805.1 hypothetical protein [Roseibium sp. RKSG952]
MSNLTRAIILGASLTLLVPNAFAADDEATFTCASGQKCSRDEAMAEMHTQMQTMRDQMQTMDKQMATMNVQMKTMHDQMATMHDQMGAMRNQN